MNHTFQEHPSQARLETLRQEGQRNQMLNRLQAASPPRGQPLLTWLQKRLWPRLTRPRLEP